MTAPDSPGLRALEIEWIPLETLMEARRNDLSSARLDRRIARSGQFPHDDRRKARPKRKGNL